MMSVEALQPWIEKGMNLNFWANDVTMMMTAAKAGLAKMKNTADYPDCLRGETMKKKILIVQPIHERGVQVFDDRFEVRVASDPSAATVIKEIKGVEGVVVRTAPFPREIIEAADSLKVIGRHGVGVDNIDVKAATEKGIVVVNTPNANATLGRGAHPDRHRRPREAGDGVQPGDARQGQWEIRNSYRAVDLDGKTLGLVGIGRIGSLVARGRRRPST